jgi:hypothetical protein
MTQPKPSKMPREEFRGVSEIEMMDRLVRLGRGVTIVVGPEGETARRRAEVVTAQSGWFLHQETIAMIRHERSF